jgi:hypothetical protein
MQPTTPEWLNYIRQAERLFDQKSLNEASEAAAQALRLNPNAALAHQVQGLVYVERLQFREALPRLQQALALRPDLVPSHNGLAQCYMHLDDLERAQQSLNAALCLDPQHAFAHFNRALLWLKRGQFAEGWVEYEWRFATGMVTRADLPRPRWDGSPLEGRTLMVHTEQGVGDTLQFIRFLPLVRRQAGRLLVACPKKYHTFLRSMSCIDDFFPVDEPSEMNFDLRCSLLSLPALLGHDGSDFHASVPYIRPDPERVRRWGERLRAFPGLKVGLNWQGSPTFHGDQFRSIPLRYFAPLAAIPNVTLFSLQKLVGTDQIEANRGSVPLTVFPDLDEDGMFLDTAALMQHLDVIISSDTSVPHLAGALGRPVWLLVARNGDWRWQIDRADSPWYPTMRLFRQWTLGDWTSVIENVSTALRQLVASRPLTPQGTPATVFDAPLSLGDLLDLIAAKEIEFGQLEGNSTTRRAVLREELDKLHHVRTRAAHFAEHEHTLECLKRLHAQLSDIESELRALERASDFGERFIELTRARLRVEDERAALKEGILPEGILPEGILPEGIAL